MVKDGMWEQTYEDGYGLDQQNDHIAHMMGQISHRYPRMNILEIGKFTSVFPLNPDNQILVSPIDVA